MAKTLQAVRAEALAPVRREAMIELGKAREALAGLPKTPEVAALREAIGHLATAIEKFALVMGG